MSPDDLAMTDHARNWIVAACCCFINLTFYGVSRMSGIMLVATTHTFHVTRAKAAVPFSLSTAIRNLAGVFVGQLGHRFGVGPVVALGCIVASLGSGLCFFAQDMEWLSICWGGLFGFGFGLSTCLLPLAINKNFVKHNGTASGISYSGAYLGSFIFPPAVVWLLDSFGLQGTYLVISGFVLNVLIAAILLREKKTKKRAISQISKDSFSSHGAVNVVCGQLETGDFWKQNINRAFVASQANLLEDADKSHYIAYISTLSQPYLLKDPILINYSQIDDVTKCNCAGNYSSQEQKPQIATHRRRLLSNVSKNFKFRRSSSRSVELEKVFPFSETNPPLPSLDSSHPDPFRISKNSFVLPSKNSLVALVGEEDFSKGVPMLPEKYLKKLLESGLLSKGKHKAKYKLKLQKLRKVLGAYLFKNPISELKAMQTDTNVKLISFKNLQSCPFKLSLQNNIFYLSMPYSISADQYKEKDQQSCHAIVQRHISTHSESEVTSETNTTTKSTCPSKDDAKSAPSSNSQNQKTTTTSLCDNTVKDNLSFDKIPYPTDERSSISLTHDDSSSTCRIEDCQSSYYVPSSNSELFQEDNLSEQTNSNGKRFKTYKKAEKAAKTCCFDWIMMIKEPMFILISLTMSVQTFMVVCVVTTLEDFAKDIGIPENRTHYALMALSISNLFGTLTLGSITDRGYISRHHFLTLCFLGMAASLFALSPFAVSITSLLSLVVVYGLLESGVVITFPILMKQFITGERQQAVAIASSNMLSAPTVMLVPMLIGHFRDNIGCYAGLFYLLGGTSLICSFLWLVAPSVFKKRSLEKIKRKEMVDAVC